MNKYYLVDKGEKIWFNPKDVSEWDFFSLDSFDKGLTYNSGIVKVVQEFRTKYKNIIHVE